MSLIINNSLFYEWNGVKRATWGLPIGDGCESDSEFNACVEHCKRNHCNGVVMCLNNEGYISLFTTGYMGNVNMDKYNRLLAKSAYLKSIGFLVVFALYDGPSDPTGKYFPILNQMDKHELFMKIACEQLNPYADAYLIGCETNRYASTEVVEAGIATMKKYTWKPVATHEQCVSSDGHGGFIYRRRFPANADFCCYETHNHPKDGDNRTAQDMVNEIQFLHSVLPTDQLKNNIWVCEHNWSFGSRSREQARAMAALPYVVGVGGPL